MTDWLTDNALTESEPIDQAGGPSGHPNPLVMLKQKIDCLLSNSLSIVLHLSQHAETSKPENSD